MSYPITPYSAFPTHDETPLTVPVFGIWPRYKAAMIDGFILYIISFVLGLVLIVSGALPPGMDNVRATVQEIAAREFNLRMISNGVSFALYTIYYVGFWGTFGATPGKMMTGQKIVNDRGHPIGYGRAFVRYLGFLVGGALLNVGYAVIAFDRQKRALHDYMAQTRVVPSDMPIPEGNDPLDFAVEGSSVNDILMVVLWYVVLGGTLTFIFGTLANAWPEVVREW